MNPVQLASSVRIGAEQRVLERDSAIRRLSQNSGHPLLNNFRTETARTV
jgi:hypothetical protein